MKKLVIRLSIVGFLTIGGIIGYSIVQSSLVGNREAAIPAMAQIQANEEAGGDIENDINGGADDYTNTKPNQTKAIETGDKGEDDLVNDSTIDKNSQGTTENQQLQQQPTGDRQLPEETTSPTEDQQQSKANDPSGKDKDLTTESKDLISKDPDLTNSEANTSQNTSNNTGDAGGTPTPPPAGQGGGSQQSGSDGSWNGIPAGQDPFGNKPNQGGTFEEVPW